MLAKAWRCSICLLVLTLTLRQMLRHIYQSHGHEPNFRIQCGIDGCPEQYRIFDSFRRHVYRLHNQYMDLDVTSLVEGDAPEICNVDIPANEIKPMDDEEDGNEEIAAPDRPIFRKISLEEISADFVLQLKFKELVTQNAVDILVAKGSSLVHLVQEKMLDEFENAIDNSASIDDLRNVIKNMREKTTTSNPFDKVKTAYFQKKYISEHYSVVAPQKIILGESITRKRKIGQLSSVVKSECFYYIPVHESLQQILSNNRMVQLLFQPKTASGEFLQDVFNGSVCKEHSLSNGQKTLFLSLYYDDFEVCNPLGSKSHKLSMFYYSILNFPLNYRSKLSSIRLLAVAYKNLIDEYGIDSIISPFVEELKTFYQGYSFMINGIEETIFVTLLNVLGDTPANNLLGGFKEGVGGSLIKCRQCYCRNEVMQTKFCENDFVLRSIDLHLANCAQLERSATKQMRNYLSTLYGINRKSLLTEVPEFDVCNNMPEDFMHVFLEGVAQYEIKEVLKHFILEPTGTFSVHDFNHKMKMFVYGYDDLDKKPTPLLLTSLHSNDNRIRQSASQMLVFLKIIPFILNDLVNLNSSKYMEFIYELLDIYHILFAPITSLGTLCLLKNLIENHLKTFKTIFPDLNIIPKQHYMIHFPMLIKKFGPVVRNWCMRFEAKHKQCKRIASKQNFANLPLSISETLQYSESIDFKSEDESHPLFSNDFIVRNSKAISDDDRSTFLSHLQRFYELDIDEVKSVHTVDHAIINGIHYISNQTYLIAEAGEVLPEFGIIRSVYIINQNSCFFQLQMYTTVCFEEVYKSYRIEIPNLAEAHIFKTLDDIVDHSSYYSVSTPKGLFIPLKYSLDDLIKRYNVNN